MRLSSIEAAEITDDFIAAAADCEHLCPHFHPALQSGSNSVLRRMRRRYSIERFLEKLAQLRERLDHPAFSTDVIVGFPGETEDEFEATLDVCRKAGFLRIHAFPFSARSGTPAALHAGQVPGEIVNRRMTALQHLERELAADYHRSLVGRSVEVIVERAVEDCPGWVEGTDRRYALVRLAGSVKEIGQMVSGVGTTVGPQYLEACR
jgi:threonylcarbamoyladenosine tRNA methylthiotransferase MtaB